MLVALSFAALTSCANVDFYLVRAAPAPNKNVLQRKREPFSTRMYFLLSATDTGNTQKMQTHSSRLVVGMPAQERTFAECMRLGRRRKTFGLMPPW